MKTASTNPEIRIRVTVINSPPGVAFQMQRGKFELLSPSRNETGIISFDVSLRLGTPLSDGRPNFLGEYAQGTSQDRFLYVNSGIRAGQPTSRWDRRAKIKLASIDHAMIKRVQSDPQLILEARFSGTGKDGGPACATVPLLDGGWKVVQR